MPKKKSIGLSYFSEIFKGRLGRGDFFLASILLSILTAVVSMFFKGAFVLRPIMMLVNLISMVIGFSLAARRAHDLEWSGWITILLLIPVVNIFVALLLLFMPGSKGSNRFGKQEQGEFFEKAFKLSLLNLS